MVWSHFKSGAFGSIPFSNWTFCGRRTIGYCKLIAELFLSPAMWKTVPTCSYNHPLVQWDSHGFPVLGILVLGTEETEEVALPALFSACRWMLRGMVVAPAPRAIRFYHAPWITLIVNWYWFDSCKKMRRIIEDEHICIYLPSFPVNIWIWSSDSGGFNQWTSNNTCGLIFKACQNLQ